MRFQELEGLPPIKIVMTCWPPIGSTLHMIRSSAQRRPRPTAPAAFCAFTVANIIAWTINKRFLPLRVISTNRGVAIIQSATLGSPAIVPPAVVPPSIVPATVIESATIKAPTPTSSTAPPFAPSTTVPSMIILTHSNTKPQFGTIRFLIPVIAIVIVISIPPATPTPATPTVTTSKRRPAEP